MLDILGNAKDDDSSHGRIRDAEGVVMIVGSSRPWHYHHDRRHLLAGSIGDAEDATMMVIIAAVSDAKDATMIVIILVIIFIMFDLRLASSNILLYILLYIEIKGDVRHPWQCKGCDDDSSQGTSRDAEDVVMIAVMTRMITIVTPVPLSSWSSSSLIRQHW